MADSKSYKDRGKGYGGFANHAFTREEAEKLSNGESVRLYGIKSNYNDNFYNVTIKENGVKVSPKTGKETKLYATSDWEKESELQKQERLAKRNSQLESKFGDILNNEPEIDLQSLKARLYNNLSKENAKHMSDTQLSDLALAAQEAADDMAF